MTKAQGTVGMHLTLNIPDIDSFQDGFPRFWLKTMFVGTITSSPRANALISTYVRLVEASLTEYRLGKERTKQFWDTHDSINLSAIHKGIAHFEACISDMHRAITCFCHLRNDKDIPENLKGMFQHVRPAFVADRIAGRLRTMRNAVHHLEQELLEGRMPEGASYTLRPDGPETPVVGEPGQTIKSIDRLTIGGLEITFADLAEWLNELGRFAEQLSNYEPKN